MRFLCLVPSPSFHHYSFLPSPLVTCFFPLFPLPQEIHQHKYCYMEYLKYYCLYFPLGFLWYHNLYLSLFIHFEFILVCSVHWRSSFHFLHVPVQFSQRHLLNRIYYSIVCTIPLCQIVFDHIDLGLFLGSLFVPLIYVSVLMPVPGCNVV